MSPFCPSPDYDLYYVPWDYWSDLTRRAGTPHISDEQAKRLTRETQIPYDRTALPADHVAVLDLYWDRIGPEFPGHKLTFAMIDRLAEHIMRCNPDLLMALRKTYPYVFLDEFQDTTIAQYDTVKTCFLRADTCVTAVGDDKQRIMGWAGAIPNAFGTFTPDFSAQRFALTANWRSHAALVDVQHAVALTLDPRSAPPNSQAHCTVTGPAAEIWTLAGPREEASKIASWIGTEIQSGRCSPSDFAILVRMKADVAERMLAPYFDAQGISLRNLARNVGKISVEDIMTEEMTKAIMPFVRLGVRRRSPNDWSAANNILHRVMGDTEDEKRGSEKVSKQLDKLLFDIRTIVGAKGPNKDSIKSLLELIVKSIGAPAFKTLHPTYRKNSGLKRAWVGMRDWLTECAEKNDTWSDLIDDFDGTKHVKLLTIHKCKGMEFHTVFCLGLDSRWRNLERLDAEEVRAFYVALSRAKQRVTFTASLRHGGPSVAIQNIVRAQGMAVLEV